MASPAQIAANQLKRPEDRGRETHESDRSELGTHGRFGSGDGQGDHLERADVIDPDGVEQHGALTSETAEIGEDAPSEANFDETMSIVEAQEFIQVTANSCALSRLDNGATQSEERRPAGNNHLPIGDFGLDCNGMPGEGRRSFQSSLVFLEQTRPRAAKSVNSARYFSHIFSSSGIRGCDKKLGEL